MIRKTVRWLACIVTALVLACGQPVAAQGAYANITEKQVEDYLQAFWTLTIWSSGQEPGYPGEPEVHPIIKFTDAIRVRILGESELALQKLREVAGWTGLKLVVLPSGDQSENLLIEVRDYAFKSPLSTRPRCETFADRNGRGDQRRHIFIDPGRVRGCLAHELGHALGFDHAHDVDSVMSYTLQKNEFTATDILMLRVLYDRRLRFQMASLPAIVAARAALVEKLMQDGAPPRTADMGWRFVQNLVPFLTDMAEKGNVAAQRELGFAYTFGEAPEIVPQDAATGHKWFARAAEKGDVRAEANVGYDLLYGRGVAKNPAEGTRWLVIAAERRHVGAQYELGMAYKYGRGVTADLAEAIRWLRLAADRGDAAAQYEIGDAYTFGKGVAKDEAAGYAWFRRAAEAGQVNAQSAVGYALLHGRGTAADPKEGIRWLRTAADRNLSYAQDFLGQAYRDGLGVGRDPVEAYKWFSLGAAKKLNRAQNNLAQLAVGLTPEQIAEGQRRAEAWRPEQ